jgi:ubiquinone/menaquinone biosynthesis C-methylase UbiE
MGQSKNTGTAFERELEETRAEYAKRAERAQRQGQPDPSGPARLATLERAMRSLLAQEIPDPLVTWRVLDVGCGSGRFLDWLWSWGASPTYLYGIDLLPERIAAAQKRHPERQYTVGSAHELPYPDGSFDLVNASLLFSSLPSRQLCQAAASEMLRVVRTGGLALVYDFTLNNPRNPAVHGVPRREIRCLFGDRATGYAERRLTLAPPLARLLARAHLDIAASRLERWGLFNTHRLTAIHVR